METVVLSKGRIALPAGIRKEDAIRPGQRFSIERIKRGSYRLVRKKVDSNHGLTDWLLRCPEKGYFKPIESE